ncbi:MAG: alpha/beta fold hydrolase [Deltaproteobacteria bacterium]|nr:alpha/beta fold hydrolase [Deltaproteobacteria bacterium]
MTRSSVTLRFSRFMAAALLCLLPGAVAAASLDDEFVTWKRHWAVTEKKFEISAKRFRLNKNLRHPRPVILIHGLLVDSRFLDYGRTSLARYLADAGFDVWNLSLRGTGRSLNPLGWGKKPWNLDDILKDDLPAVLEYVRETTGEAEVFMVGFDLGGALAFAHAGTVPEHGVAGIVGIAAPMSFDSPEQDGLDVLLRLDRNPTLRNALLYWSSSALNRYLFMLPGLKDVFYNPGNMDPRVAQQLQETLLIPVNPGVLDQLTTIVDRDEFVSADGAVSYRDALSNIRVPVLLVGGAADPIAPPEALKTVYSEIASEDRDLMIFWSDPEEDTRYGHFDLILGRNARKEVFPLIRRWLELQDRR